VVRAGDFLLGILGIVGIIARRSSADTAPSGSAVGLPLGIGAATLLRSPPEHSQAAPQHVDRRARGVDSSTW
jgi:hypothetical protein